MTTSDIPKKANRVLHFILLAFLLILIRIWYLCIIEHDAYLELSKKPQKKTSLEKPLRGTIRDRFNIPLAVNKIQYDAAICYDHIRQIPAIKRSKDAQGKTVKHYLRREYIEKLSSLLAKELQLDPLDIEDFIYGKASLFPSTPFVLKEDISEKVYYYLKGLERSYVGICPIRNLKRFYPQNKTGADLIGYIGSINEQEYFAIAHEIKELENYLNQHQQGDLVFLPKGFSSFQEIKERLYLLKGKMYQFNDKLGKAGIEASFDDQLRGTYGKKSFEINTKGSIVRQLPGSKNPIPGQRLLLNISAELQEFAEALLAENEAIRDQRFPKSGKDHAFVSPPWIKGGAIVAMIPTTGEIVAMASYPRVDNNDFTLHSPSSSKVSTWLENKNYIRDLWDGKIPLEREFYSFTNHSFYTEEKKLTLEHYLERVLSLHGSTKKTFQRITSLSTAVDFQNAFALLLDLSEQPYMHALVDALYPKGEQHKVTTFSTNDLQINHIQTALSQHELLVKDLRFVIDKILFDVPHNDDKLLVLDLVRLIVPKSTFNETLLTSVGTESLSTYRKLTQSLSIVCDEVKKSTKEYFHLHDFRVWRQLHFKEYLAQKRLEEKEKKTYQRPYIDYLKKVESDQFNDFWKKNKWELIQLFLAPPSSLENTNPLACYLKEYKETLRSNLSLHQHLVTSFDLLESRLKNLDPSLNIPYLKTMRSYNDLSEKLYGYYSQIQKRRGTQTEKDLAGAFHPPQGYGYGRSYAFRQSTPLGSIFKIITAYEALKQNYERGAYATTSDLNPLTIIDEIQPSSKEDRDMVLGLHADGKKITRHYKGGTLPRTRLDVRLGKIDYLKAFERSSNIYFSLLASDVIQEPNDLAMASLKFGFGNKTGIDLPGEIPGVLPKDLNENRTGLYAFAIGQHSLIATPLQTAVMLSSLVNEGEVLKPQIVHLKAGFKDSSSSLFSGDHYSYQDYLNRVGIFFPFFLQTHEDEKKMDIKLFEKTLYRKLFLPSSIKNYLLEAMHNVVSSPSGAARAELIRYFYNNTRAMRNYLKLKYQLAGKTSTAEIAYHPTLDRECPFILCKDIWFGGVAFNPPTESSIIQKKPDDIPELVVVVYLKFGNFGKETAPLAGEIVTKWREIRKKHGKSSYVFSEL